MLVTWTTTTGTAQQLYRSVDKCLCVCVFLEDFCVDLALNFFQCLLL